MQKLLLNILIFFSLYSVFGAITYRLYSLNFLGIFLSLFLTITSFIILNRNQNNKKKEQKKKINFKSILSFYLFFYLLIVFYLFWILLKSNAGQTISSPWQVLPSYFFFFYFLSALLLLYLSISKIPYKLFWISLFYFLSFSVIYFIYRIGYGFDYFVHIATEKLIAQKGVVEPKPFYYLGQYALSVLFLKLTHLEIDRILIPLLGAIYLPLFLFKFLNKTFDNKNAVYLTIVLALIFPYSFLTFTTPQNLAFLLLLLLIFCSFFHFSSYTLITEYILALATFFIHPLAGISANLFVFANNIRLKKIKFKKYFYSIIFFFSATSLPLAFYIFHHSPIQNIFSKLSLKNDLLNFWQNLQNPYQDNFILNFVYLYGFNFALIYIILVLIGIFMVYKYKQGRKFFLFLLFSTSLFLAYFLNKLNSFDFLIHYEQNDYGKRILFLAFLFLIPFVFVSIYAMAKTSIKQNRISKFIIFLLFSILISSSFYLSYPRKDAYYNSHEFSVSKNDLEAIKWIDKQGGDYVVLANQQVSALALKEFGFKKYYNDIFYYPIPTSSPLYKYYLEMVNKNAGKENAQKAMDLCGVNKVYFVLNKYWWAFPKIKKQAESEASTVKSFGGEVFVFEWSDIDIK